MRSSYLGVRQVGPETRTGTGARHKEERNDQRDRDRDPGRANGTSCDNPDQFDASRKVANGIFITTSYPGQRTVAAPSTPLSPCAWLGCAVPF